MQIQQGGRHCAHCEKVVTDFTRMTDAQLIEFFKKNDGAQCGRFRAEQLERTIRKIETPKSNIWARVAASLLLAFGLVKSADAQTRKDLTETVVPRFSDETIPKASSQDKISGILFDENGHPIINAEVVLKQDGIVIEQAITDYDGQYQISTISRRNHHYTVSFHYLKVSETYTNIPSGGDIVVNGTLRLAKSGQKSYIFMGYVQPMERSGRRTFRSEEIERTP